MTRDRLDQIALRKWCFNNRFAPYPSRSAEHELLTRRLDRQQPLEELTVAFERQTKVLR